MSRRTWAVVPAKSLRRGKSRLRDVLGDGDRALFARELLEHVLGVLDGCALDGLLVATDGDDVAQLVAGRGAHVLRDRSGASLAEIVDRALAEVALRGAQMAIVFMADLPRLEPADVRDLLAALDDHDVAVVSDHRGRHTNALGLAPPTAMPTYFGHDDSFAAHCAAARAAGLRAAVMASERIAFDVDVPSDHRRLMARRAAVET